MEGTPAPKPSVAGSLTRRTLLRKGAFGATALVVTPAFLAACGSDGSTGSTSATSAGAEGRVGGTLNYLGWQGEDFTELLAPWRKENGVKVQASFIANMSDIAAKYAGGGGAGFDIINLSSNGVYRLLGSGVPFMPLDLQQIPNYEGLTQFFREDPDETFVNEDGEVVAIPITWGAIGICYDDTVVEKEPSAWSDLLKSEFTGKITIIDDPSTCFGTAGAILGYTPNEMTKEEMEKTQDYLAQFVAQAKTFAPSFGDMATQLASGEVTAGFCGFTSINAFAAEAGNPNVKTSIFLEEGSASFAECYGIPSTGANPATAYSMIDTLLDPANNAVAANTLVLAPAVQAAWSEVNSTVKPLFPKSQAKIEEFLGSSPMVLDAPAQSDEFVTFGEVTEAWTEVKAVS